MKQTAFFAASIFCFVVGGLASPMEWGKPWLWVYKYEGRVETRSSANKDEFSTWFVTANLSAYNSQKHVVLKLDDIKTSLFNGKRTDLKNAHEKEIPEESKALLKPFFVKNDGENFFIYFEPDEPLWSKNFKRGIASNMDVNIIKIAESNKNQIFKEKSVHGYCDVSYNIEETDSKKVYQKIINHDECSEFPDKGFINLKGKAPNSKDHRQHHTKTVKTATFLPNPKGVFIPYKIESSSNIVVKFTPNAKNTQHLDQYQKFDLTQQSEVDESPDVSKITEKHDLIYEADIDPTLGRHIYELDTSTLVLQFLGNYSEFEKKYMQTPAAHVDMSTNDEIDNMFEILWLLSAEGLEALEDEFLKRPDFLNIFTLYYSMIPYIGTNEFVKHLVQNVNDQKFRFNEVSMSRMLSTFPYFLQYPSEEMLEDLEVLLELKQTQQRSGKNSGVFSFATALIQINKKAPLSQEKLDKYIKLYHNKFLTSEDYEERMSFLLGLINMADILDFTLINSITTNKTECKHIRTLALTGFKSKLAKEETQINYLYNTYWAIVQCKKTPFEVRVSALDLLLSLKLSDEQFNTIIKKYSLHFNDPQERLLANYLLTSLHSLQNITEYNDNLGAKALEALKTNEIPSYPKLFATGNYRVSQTDEDFGSLVEVQIISDPVTNAFDVVKLTYNSYGYSYDLGTYTIYINMDGLIDSLYTEYFMKNLKDASSVPELLKMLENSSFELNEIKREIHIDIVVFSDDVAVYAAHYGKYDKTEMRRFLEDLGNYFEVQLFLQYPVVDYKHTTSDLGTPLQFSNLVQKITFQDSEVNNLFHLKHTSSYQSWIESYNPLVDTNIASYKYIGSEIYTKHNFTIKKQKNSAFWIDRNNSISLYWDNVIGTYVEDEEVLAEYCKECEAYSQNDFEYSTNETNSAYEEFGLKTATTLESSTNHSKYYSIADFVKNHTYSINDDATFYATPFLHLSNFLNYKMVFSHDLSRGSYEFVPSEEDIETSISVIFDGDLKKYFKPMIKKMYAFELQFNRRALNDDKPKLHWAINCDLSYDPNYNKEEKKSAVAVEYKIHYVPQNESLAKHICVEREILIPFGPNDKYSLEEIQPSIGKLSGKFSEKDDINCDGAKNSFSWVETLSSSSKADKLKNRQNKKDYDECQENSKGLMFIDPSSTCRRISQNLVEYDNYQVNFTREYQKEDGEVVKQEIELPFIEFTRKGDYFKFALLKMPIFLTDDDNNYYFNKTIYYPYSAFNPVAITFGEFDYGLPFLSQSTCTITPSTIEQFSGKFIPNQHDKHIAFAECFNSSTKGLNAHTTDNHIEFLFYSKQDVLNVEYKEGKVEMQLNGKDLHETYDPKDSEFKVFMLDTNVFYIMDDQYHIYYNTEYLQIRVNSLHSKLLCGICTKDQ